MNSGIVNGVEVAHIMSYVRFCKHCDKLCVPCIKVGDLGHLLSKDSDPPSTVENICRLVNQFQIRRNYTY